jgi:hypothetical protein
MITLKQSDTEHHWWEVRDQLWNNTMQESFLCDWKDVSVHIKDHIQIPIENQIWDEIVTPIHNGLWNETSSGYWKK